MVCMRLEGYEKGRDSSTYLSNRVLQLPLQSATPHSSVTQIGQCDDRCTWLPETQRGTRLILCMQLGAPRNVEYVLRVVWAFEETDA
jgi:hypothetical protein